MLLVVVVIQPWLVMDNPPRPLILRLSSFSSQLIFFQYKVNYPSLVVIIIIFFHLSSLLLLIRYPHYIMIIILIDRHIIQSSLIAITCASRRFGHPTHFDWFVVDHPSRLLIIYHLLCTLFYISSTPLWVMIIRFHLPKFLLYDNHHNRIETIDTDSRLILTIILIHQ